MSEANSHTSECGHDGDGYEEHVIVGGDEVTNLAHITILSIVQKMDGLEEFHLVVLADIAIASEVAVDHSR